MQQTTNQAPESIENKPIHHEPKEIYRKPRYTSPIVVRFTSSERDQIHAAAAARDISVNGYIREKLGCDISTATGRRKRRADSPTTDRSRPHD